MQNYINSVTDTNGNAVAGATVTVLKSDGTAAVLYAANGSSQYPSNVLTADATGEYSFYAANGTYTITVTSLNFTGQTNSGIVLFDPLDIGIANTSDGLNSIARSGAPSTQSAVGQLLNVTNSSATPGYGVRVNYYQTGAQSSGFSIGHGSISVFTGTNGGQGLASWLVSASPTNAANTFGIFGQEVNPINRASDSGYSKTRGALARWTGGIQLVPEATDLILGGTNTFNCTFGLAITPSSANKTSDGFPAKSYNAVLIEKDAVAPGGRGVLYSGNSSGNAGQNPLYAGEIDQTWAAGFCTTAATFSSGVAAIFGTDHQIRWGTSETDTTGGSIYGDTATSSLYLDYNNLHTIRMQSVASQINYWQMYGGATGVGANLVATGGDPNIDAIIQGKGTSGIRLKDGGGAVKFQLNTTGVGFYGVTPVARATTAGGSAAFVANAGTAINTLSTFDGYTIPQIVTALRNIGALT